MSTPPASSTPRRDTLPSRWRGQRENLRRMDEDIAAVYAERGIHGVRPRYSMALMFLEDGPLSIRELAREVDVTHSAMSQTVSAMQTDGLVRATPGTDARSRMIELTEEGRRIVPTLRAEWFATEDVLAELDAELPYSYAHVVADLAAALDRRAFRDRLRERLDARLDAAAEGRE